MKMAEELQRELRSINRKSYPAYKGLKGAYQFPDYQLFIEHVQGDPFAAPSALRIFVPHSRQNFRKDIIGISAARLHCRMLCSDVLRKYPQNSVTRQKAPVRAV